MRCTDRPPRHKTWIVSLIMSTRNLPTPPPEGPAEASTGTPAETDQTTPPATGSDEAAASTHPPPSQPQPTQLHTIHREIFPLIANKVIDRDWSGLAMLAELH